MVYARSIKPFFILGRCHDLPSFHLFAARQGLFTIMLTRSTFSWLSFTGRTIFEHSCRANATRASEVFWNQLARLHLSPAPVGGRSHRPFCHSNPSGWLHH